MGQDILWDVPGQSRMGRPVVPLSWDKKTFPCPVVPLSRDKKVLPLPLSLCPRTRASAKIPGQILQSRDLPGCPGPKNPRKEKKKKKNKIFFSKLFSNYFFNFFIPPEPILEPIAIILVSLKVCKFRIF